MFIFLLTWWISVVSLQNLVELERVHAQATLNLWLNILNKFATKKTRIRMDLNGSLPSALLLGLCSRESSLLAAVLGPRSNEVCVFLLHVFWNSEGNEPLPPRKTTASWQQTFQLRNLQSPRKHRGHWFLDSWSSLQWDKQAPHEHYEKAKRYDTERWTLHVARCPLCYWRRLEK